MRTNRPRPVPAPCDGFQATLRDAESWRDWVIPWINWLAVSAMTVFAATLLVGGVLVGDWDDPVPPHLAVSWSIASLAAVLTLLVAWRTKSRSVKVGAVLALPLQALLWAAEVLPSIERASA